MRLRKGVRDGWKLRGDGGAEEEIEEQSLAIETESIELAQR